MVAMSMQLGKAILNGKRAIVIAVAVAAWSTGAAAEGEPTLQPISGAVYLFKSADYVATNYVVYVGKHTVTVAGATWTPATARRLDNAIKAITQLPVTEVIDTSPDPEWSGGNAYWKSIGAKILAVRATADLLRAKWAPMTNFMAEHASEYSTKEISAPDQIVPDEFDLQNGAVKLLFLGASHTQGDVFVYFPNEGILDAGSILKEQLGNLANADLAEYPRTLEKLQIRGLRIVTIVSGHWSPLQEPGLIQHYLSLLKQHEADSK